MAAPSLEDMLAAINKQLGTSSPATNIPSLPQRVTPSVAAPRAAVRGPQPYLSDRDEGGGGLGGFVLNKLAWLDKPRAAVMSTLKEFTDLATGKGFSLSDWKDQVDRHYGFGEYQQEYLKGIENVAMPDWVPGLGGKKVLRYATALIGDVMTDPFMLAGALSTYWRASKGGKMLFDDMVKIAGTKGAINTPRAIAANVAVDALHKNKNNVSSAIRALKKHGTEGYKLIEEFGLDAGLRWREIGSGPILGGVGRKLLPNRTARRLAEQVSPRNRDLLAQATGRAVDSDDFNDLLARGIQASWKDEVWAELAQTAAIKGQDPTAALNALRRSGRVPIERAFVPKWITTKPVLPGLMVGIMSSPGVVAGRISRSALGRAAGTVFNDNVTEVANKIMREADRKDPMYNALMNLGVTTDSARAASSARQGIFVSERTSATRRWIDGAVSPQGGFRKGGNNYRLMGSFVDYPLESLEAALEEMRDEVAGGPMLEGLREWAAGWARQGVDVPIGTVDDIWRLVELRQRWRTGVANNNFAALLEIFGPDSDLVREMERTLRMSGDYSPGIMTRQGRLALMGNGKDGQLLNPHFGGREADEWWLSEQTQMGDITKKERAKGRTDEPFVPDPKDEKFRGKVKGRFSRRRSIHGPFFDSDAVPSVTLGRVGVPRHVGAEEGVSRGLHPTAPTREEWLRTGGGRPGDPPSAGPQGDAIRPLPAEPDQMLEAVTEAVVGPRLGIDFEPRSLDDFVESKSLIGEGTKLKLGGVGLDGSPVIPADVDKMALLKFMDPTQFEAQVDKQVRKLLNERVAALAERGGVELDKSAFKGLSNQQFSEKLGVPYEAVRQQAIDELNKLEYLSFRLQRGTDDVFEYRTREGADETVSLREVYAARGWTDPVNRFGWGERQQLDHLLHGLRMLDEGTSTYVLDLPLREAMWVRGISQDVHMRIFERKLNDAGIIFSTTEFDDITRAYQVFMERTAAWSAYGAGGPRIPKNMSVDEFVRRITGQEAPAGARPPRPGGDPWFDEAGKPISLTKFMQSLPEGSRWRKLAQIYSEAVNKTSSKKAERAAAKIRGLEVDTPEVRAQMDEASAAVQDAVDDLQRLAMEIESAQTVMMASVRAIDPDATLGDLFTEKLLESSLRVANHIPDLDGTLIREWDVVRWADMTKRSENVLTYLNKVREELAAVTQRGPEGERLIGRQLTSPAEEAVRTERAVALQDQRAVVAASMGVAVDSPIPEGRRTWRRLMAYISPAETGTRKRTPELAPDEARISWGADVSVVPTDQHRYNKGGFRFWKPPGGGRIVVRRETERYGIESGWIQVGRPDNADALIASAYGRDAVERGVNPTLRGEDIPAADRTLIKIENPYPEAKGVSPRPGASLPTEPPEDLVVPEKLLEAAELAIRRGFASAEMILNSSLNVKGIHRAKRMIGLLEDMGIVQPTSGPHGRVVVAKEIPENFDELAMDAVAAENERAAAKQMEFEDAVRAGEVQDPNALRPAIPGGRLEVRFDPYSSTEIDDVGAGLVVLRRGFSATGPRDAWDDVYRAIVGPNRTLDEALVDPTAGEGALLEFYASHFPARYATGRPPRSAGPNRNYVWMGKDELFAMKVMKRAATLRRIQLEAAAGDSLKAADERFLTKTMGYRTVGEALENIDDDVLVLAELGLNPFAKRVETGARIVDGDIAREPTARMVPGETAEEVAALVATAQERMQRVASRHGLDTAGGKGITAAESEGLVDKALADVLAMGKRRSKVRSVVKEVDAEAAARVAADPNVPSEIAALPWTERDLSVLDGIFADLAEEIEGPVSLLRDDLIPLMLRLKEQKMATDETVEAAEKLFEILSDPGPTGSFVKGASPRWGPETVLGKYEQIVDDVKRLEDFFGLRISGEGRPDSAKYASTRQSPMGSERPFGPLPAMQPFLREKLRRAYGVVPPGPDSPAVREASSRFEAGPFAETVKSVKGVLGRVISGAGKELVGPLLDDPVLRAKWTALARAYAEVLEYQADEVIAKQAIWDNLNVELDATKKLRENARELAKQEGTLAEETEKAAALPAKLQRDLDKLVATERAARPDLSGPEPAGFRVFEEGEGPLPGGMLGANGPAPLLEGATPTDVVQAMALGHDQAQLELAEIAYYSGLTEQMLALLPEKEATAVRKRILDELASDPAINDTVREQIVENGWLGAQARKAYLRDQGPDGPLHWMYGGKTTTALDPTRIPAEGLRELLAEGTRMWGANLIASAPDREVANLWTETVTEVLQAAQKSTDREQVGELLVGYDKVHNWLKAQLVATPGFVMRNMLGGVTNMWFKDIPPTEIIRTGRMMQKAYRAGDGDLVAGVRVMAEQNPKSLSWGYMQDLVNTGAHSGGQAASAVDVGMVGRSRREFYIGQRTIDKPGMRVVYSPTSPEFAPWAAVRHANTFAEEAMRLATGMHAMKVWGDTTEDALYMIHKLHFDYGKLSDIERKGMRRVFPFYTWTRNNLPLQVEFMAKHPAKYNRMFSLKREMERNTPEEGTVPHYFLEPFGIRLPFQISGAQTYSVPDTPFQDLLRYDPSYGGIGSTIEQLVSQATPIAKVPVEYWAGKQVFAGIPFSERYQQVPALMERVPGLMHALQQIGWAQRSKKGEWKMQDNRIYLVGNLMPYIGVLQRAIPGLPGREKRKQERYISALISTLGGLSVRMNTRYEQESERVRREIERHLSRRNQRDVDQRTR